MQVTGDPGLDSGLLLPVARNVTAAQANETTKTKSSGPARVQSPELSVWAVSSVIPLLRGSGLRVAINLLVVSLAQSHCQQNLTSDGLMVGWLHISEPLHVVVHDMADAGRIGFCLS